MRIILVGKRLLSRVAAPIYLSLALWTIVCASSRHYNFLDGSLADQAGFAAAPVGAMLELKESFLTFGIHIIRDGGTSGGNGLLQHLLKSGMEFGRFLPGQRTGTASRADSRAEQALICIDVPYSVQHILIQQRSFDGGLASSE